MRKLEQEVQFVKEEEEVEPAGYLSYAAVSVHSEGLGGKHIQRIAPKKKTPPLPYAVRLRGGGTGRCFTPLSTNQLANRSS